MIKLCLITTKLTNNINGRIRKNNALKLIGPLDAFAIYTILKNQSCDLIRARMAAVIANARFVILAHGRTTMSPIGGAKVI